MKENKGWREICKRRMEKEEIRERMKELNKVWEEKRI